MNRFSPVRDSDHSVPSIAQDTKDKVHRLRQKRFIEQLETGEVPEYGNQQLRAWLLRSYLKKLRTEITDDVDLNETEPMEDWSTFEIDQGCQYLSHLFVNGLYKGNNQLALKGWNGPIGKKNW